MKQLRRTCASPRTVPVLYSRSAHLFTLAKKSPPVADLLAAMPPGRCPGRSQIIGAEVRVIAEASWPCLGSAPRFPAVVHDFRLSKSCPRRGRRTRSVGPSRSFSPSGIFRFRLSYLSMITQARLAIGLFGPCYGRLEPALTCGDSSRPLRVKRCALDVPA